MALSKPLDKKRKPKFKRRDKVKKFKQRREVISTSTGLFNGRIFRDIKKGLSSKEFTKEQFLGFYGVNLDNYPTIGLVPDGDQPQRRIFGVAAKGLDAVFSVDNIADYTNEVYRYGERRDKTIAPTDSPNRA